MNTYIIVYFDNKTREISNYTAEGVESKAKALEAFKKRMETWEWDPFRNVVINIIPLE